MDTKITNPKITKVITLLAQSDTHEGQAIESYVQACEALHAGRAKQDSVLEYITRVTQVSAEMGHIRSERSFMNMWRVGVVLAEKRIKRAVLLECESRNEILGRLPLRSGKKARSQSNWISIRVSKRVHKLLVRQATKGETFDSVISKLLPAVRAVKTPLKKAA